MSLATADASVGFNECSSQYSHDQLYSHVQVERGCISLFNNDISKYAMSTMITFCGCEVIGPKKYDFVSLQNAGLVSKAGAGLISFVATGKDTSITIYNTPDFTGDEGDHTVIGPEVQTPCSRIKRGTEEHWDNAIYSLILQAWNSCEQEEEIVCSPITTAPPAPVPTPSPFIQPTAKPTRAPVINPTAEPSDSPTPGPTNRPRARPTMEPLARPTLFPTMDPTKVYKIMFYFQSMKCLIHFQYLFLPDYFCCTYRAHLLFHRATQPIIQIQNLPNFQQMLQSTSILLSCPQLHHRWIQDL